jgi:hypothetical protein
VGPWALTQLPAMQGEVSGPPFGQSREALPPSPHPTWGWAQGAPTGTHKAQDPATGRWAPYMQTMLNMQLGDPHGVPLPLPHWEMGPSSSWSQAAWPCLQPYSLAYHSIPTQHGIWFSLSLSQGPFIPFSVVTSQELPLPAGCPFPLLALQTPLTA